MRRINYFAFISLFLFFSCSSKTELSEYAKKRLEFDASVRDLAKKYNVKYLLDTMDDITYSIETDKLIKAEALMLDNGTVQDLIKKNDSTYIIRVLYSSYLIDINTNEKKMLEQFMDKKDRGNLVLIIRLNAIQKVAVNFNPLVMWDGYEEESSYRKEYVEIESTTSNLFYGNATLIHYEYLED